MDANSFSSSSAYQSSTLNERFKPVFQPVSTQLIEKDKNLDDKDVSSLRLNVDQHSGRQVFSKSIEFSLGLKVNSSYEFEVPSPQDVATTVLGFVENRIKSEKLAGASTEKLNDLMAQAKSGIEKGYALAEQDIRSLGLMTDDLAEDIETGFNLITKGLSNISNQVIGYSLNESGKDLDTNRSADQSLQEPVRQDGVFNESALKDISSAIETKPLLLKHFSENSADFVLNTREGDQILIRSADLQSLSYSSGTGQQSLTSDQISYFEFSVKGDLNEKELAAVNDLLGQVSNIASLFFDEQFDAAFASALNLGFDSEQIASFSLDLSKLQVQEVRSYQDGAKTALDSYKRNQPLVNIAQQYERIDALLEPLARFEELHSMVEALVSKAIESYSVEIGDDSLDENGPLNDYQLFSSALLNGVLFADEKATV